MNEGRGHTDGGTIGIRISVDMNDVGWGRPSHPLVSAFAPLLPALAAVAMLTTLSGCSSLTSADSPDVIYTASAEEARSLQIPPDLTDVSNAEQFILPGTSGGPVTRNTLLPEFADVRFERAGQQSWLAIDKSPEEVWPQLLAFARKEKFTINQTAPVAGVIVTEWRPASAVAKGSLLQSLIGGDEEFSRMAFRLERNGAGTRLFARSQSASEKDVAAEDSGSAAWPASSHDPEATSALLTRLLVFFGVEEQKARGILDAEQARMVTDDALVLTNSSGSQLIMQRGFKSSFTRVLAGLKRLNYTVTSSDDGVGRIEFLDGETPLVIELMPQHISEVRVALSDTEGRRLPGDQEQLMLNALLGQIV